MIGPVNTLGSKHAQACKEGHAQACKEGHAQAWVRKAMLDVKPMLSGYVSLTGDFQD